jgi:hypothetical protein
MNNELLKYYDNNSSVTINDVYINSEGNFINSDIMKFDKNNILEMCKKMEAIYLNETKCSKELDELNIKNSNIRLECIKANLDYEKKLVLENTVHKYEEYESDSECVSSEEINKKILIVDEKLKESDSECVSSEEINKKILIVDEKLKNEAILKIQKELELLEKEIIHQTP